MLRLLLSIFLCIYSIIGLSFYQGTIFGDFLDDLELGGVMFAMVINFIVAHLINLFIKGPLSFLSQIGLILVGFLLALAVGLWVPYWFIFLLIGANDSNLFPWTIYLMITITFIAMVVGPIIHSSIGFLIKLNENFWDGLSQNAINSALEKSKKKK
jgi:hypothetical protein